MNMITFWNNFPLLRNYLLKYSLKSGQKNIIIKSVLALLLTYCNNLVKWTYDDFYSKLPNEMIP